MATSIVTDLVFEEIERTVADAVVANRILRASTTARRLKETYPGCQFKERQITDLVIGFAYRAGLAVEFGHPRNSRRPSSPEHGLGLPHVPAPFLR